MQVPAEHAGVPLLLLQTLPQLPQLDVVVVSVSHPLLMLPSQFARPALHVMSLQVPPVHEGVPPVVLQALPHVPQLVIVVRSVSQPFDALPSQFPQSGLQVMPQLPEAHVAVPFVVLQALPQALQCRGLVLMLVSQPLLTSTSQSSYPSLHVMPQAPFVQLAAPWLVLHELVHEPQRVGVLFRSVSQPLLALPSQSS